MAEPKIIAILSVCGFAMIGLIDVTVTGVIGGTAISAVEQNLPQSTSIVEKAQQADELKSSVDDANHARIAYNTGSFSPYWGFGSAFGVIVIALLAIWRIIIK